jgi:hypothetical protein
LKLFTAGELEIITSGEISEQEKSGLLNNVQNQKGSSLEDL